MQRPFRIGLPAAASLLVNGLLIAALFNLGMGRPQRTAAPALAVFSLAVLKGAEEGDERARAAAQSAPAPPGAAPAPEPAPVAPPEKPVMPQAAPPPPIPSPLARPAPAAAAAAAPSQAAAHAATAQARAASGAAAPPARRGVADGLDADAPAGTSRAYAARVRSWLYAHKTYPRRARMRREEGIVRVRFVLDRAGLLLEGQIVGSSGRASLDEEAMGMMRRASPYPRAPREIAGERIEFTAPVEFVLPV